MPIRACPAEYSNWRDEQWAWQHTCVLYNQSYHMVDLAVEGPDAFAMLNHLGINSFKGFVPDKAKQFVPVTPEGFVIGDVILFYLAENQFNLVGRAPVIEWVEFHAATGDWNVKVERDERTAMRTDGRRKTYRFQIQGPNAMQAIEKALGQHPARPQILQHDDGRDRREDGRARCATAWPASPASNSSARGTMAKRCAPR